MKTIYSALLISISLMGCVITPKPSVVKYSVDSQAIVAVGDVPLAAGDEVTFLREKCRDVRRNFGPVRDASRPVCSRDFVGLGDVVGLTAQAQDAVVEARKGVEVSRGLIVEKQ